MTTIPDTHPIHYEAARFDLRVRGLLDSYRPSTGKTRYTIQLVHQPCETYTKYFCTIWADDPAQLIDDTTETLSALEDTVNIFSTELFEYLSGDMFGDKSKTFTIKNVPCLCMSANSAVMKRA